MQYNSFMAPLTNPKAKATRVRGIRLHNTMTWEERAVGELANIKDSFDKLQSDGPNILLLWPRMFIGEKEVLLGLCRDSAYAKMFPCPLNEDDEAEQRQRDTVNFEFGTYDGKNIAEIYYRIALNRENYNRIRGQTE